MASMFDLSLRLPLKGPAGVPGLNNLRFFGAPHWYTSRTLAPYHDQPVVPVTAGNGSAVVAFGPEAVKQVFTDNTTFPRFDSSFFPLPPGQPWSRMFEAVLTANGEEHRRRRKLLMPIVHRSALAHYEKVFTETVQQSRFANDTDDTPFDLAGELVSMSMRNMLIGILGIEDSPENRALAARVIAVNSSFFRPQVLLFQVNRSWTPLGRWVAEVGAVYGLLSTLIEERRRNPTDRQDALSIICATVDESGDQLSTQEIVGELHGIFAAGFESTASTMTWALLTILGSSTGLDYTDPDVLDAAIKESQRLIPAVPITLPRRVAVDASIAGSPPVPAGALLFLSSLVEQHRATTYPEPEVFRPQRFIDADQPEPATFFPFGIGARRCLGAPFADLQTRVTLAPIVAGRPLRLLTSRVDPGITTGVVTMPKQPVMVSFDSATTAAKPAKPPKLTGEITRLWRQRAD